MYNLRFPREICNPKRTVVRNTRQFINFVNANSPTSSIYTNVYNFSKFREPYPFPIYETAIIDRIYFDLDKKIVDNGYTYHVDAYENLIKIHNWCKERKILHFPRCTGSAYDIIIATEPNSFINNKKQCVFNAQTWLCEELDIKMDKQVKGDIARIHRVDNTYNHKPTAKRFCIPLDEKIINLGEKTIFELAKYQRFFYNGFGHKYWNIEEFDTDIMNNIEFDRSSINLDSEDFADLSPLLPDCIKMLLSKGNLGWNERRIVIIGLRDNCYTFGEAVEILRKYLNPAKFRHCMKDERQPHYLYGKDKYMFPVQSTLIQNGLCPFKENEYCEKACYGCLLYKRNKGEKNGNFSRKISSTKSR